MPGTESPTLASSTPAAASSPSSTPSSAPPAAAPSSSAAPSALASLERAASAADATAAASAGTPSTGTPTGGAITPPAPTTGTLGTPTADGSMSGEAPAHRIEAAVRNVREEMERELGWARQVGTRQDVERAVQLIRALDANPRAFYQQLTQELGIADAPATPPTPERVDPTADLRSEDGKEAFSAGAVRQLLDNAIARVKSELLEQVQPALEFTTQSRQQMEQARIESEVTTQAADTAREVFATLNTLPHFTEQKANISAAYKAIPESTRAKVGSVAALYMAYNQVLAQHVLPTLSQQAQQQTLADLKRSAVAGAAGAPAGVTPTPKPVIRDGDVDGLAKHLESLTSAMAQA